MIFSNKPRCMCFTSNKTQCKNSAKYKCNKTGDIIYCGIHNKINNYPTTKLNNSVNNLTQITRVNKLSKTHKFATKIQSEWRMYKERCYKCVFNNGINSSTDVSILTLEPIRTLKDAFIFHKTINGSKRWYMESIESMYNWYIIYKKSVNNKQIPIPIPIPNMKCVYTQEELSDEEQKYIIDIFDKVIRYYSDKYLKTSIISVPVPSLYESILDKCFKTFTDSTDSVYIDTLMKMSNDSICRLIKECSKIFNYNKKYDVFKSHLKIIDNINKKKYTHNSLYALYTDGTIKLTNNSDTINIIYFIKNQKIIEDKYKILLMKDYFITTIMRHSELDDMLLYYVRLNNIWFYSVTGLYFEDIPMNDTIVSEFNMYPGLNTNELLLR